MNRSQSWRRLPSDEGAEFKEDKRASSHPNLSQSASLSTTAGLRGSRHHSAEDLRRKIVSLNKELEAEKAFVKQLRREKSLDLKHAREEEQRRAASMQTDLKTKLHKEKTNELTALREQLHKDKEKEILQIIKQKDDALRTAQQSWGKEKDELRGKIRGEMWSEAREESRKEFDRERTRLEQEILDLQMQKKELEESYKTLQESDKRKADEIRRIFHEHEIELEKFKRNSWQESRRQMGEIRQLLNIIEQLERKLGIDSGHINKLRMEKEGLYEELRKKTNTFDAWDSMMSSSMKTEGSTAGPTIPPPHTDPKYHGVSQEIRTLQRKNTELSSLVKKLDEKNQQLATKNAELLSELERSDKDARDKHKKLEKKNLEIAQNTKILESKNKALQEEISALKRKPGPASSSGKDVGSKKGAIRPRGQGTSQTDGPEVTKLKHQIKDQSKTIEELKQNLMEKERRIDLLKQRRKSGKKQKLGRTSVDAVLQQEHDDAASGVSDVSSDISEMSSTDSSSDASKLKKLTKELLALERAYALLQAQVGGTVDVERDELERQQLQSDLIESQTRIHELERMMDNNAQGGSEDLHQLQHDNKILYQKLIAAENERDRALSELSKNSEDLRDLQDKKDLLEFELEEMSQMSFAGSEDSFASPRKMRDKEDRKLPLSLEEVKAYLEEMENEKANVLNVMEIEALKQARTSLTALPQKISHLEATEAVLRSKVKDLEEKHLLDSQGTMQYDSHMEEPETLSEVLELDASDKDHTDSTRDKTDFTLLDIDKHFQEKQLMDKECVTELTCTLLCDMERMYEKFLRDHKQEAETLYHKPIITFDEEKSDAECMTDFKWGDNEQEAESLNHKPIITFDTEKNDAECMTDFIWEDIVEIEETYQEFLTNIEGLELNLAKAEVKKLKMMDKRTTTDMTCDDISALVNKGKQLDQLQESLSREKDVEKHEQESSTEVIQCFDRESNTDVIHCLDRESNTEVIEKHEIESNTDLTWDDMLKEEEISRSIMLKVEQLESELSKAFSKKDDVEIMTDVVWKDVVKREELYKGQIEELPELLVMEQELREADEMKLVEYEMLKEANAAKKTAEISVMTDGVWIEDPAERLQGMVQDLVVKAKNDAVAEIAGETIDDLQHCLLERLSICQTDQQTGTDITGVYIETLQTSRETNTSELTRLREIGEKREKRLEELQDELANTLIGKGELETMNDLMREEFSEREEMYKRQINELQEKLSMEREIKQSHETKLLEYEALKEADVKRPNEDKNIMTELVWIEDSAEVLERTARQIVERSMNKAMLEVAHDIICDLQTRPVITDILDTKEDLDQLNEDKNITTEMVWIEDPTEVLERTARQIVERSMIKAMLEVAHDIICDLQTRPVITDILDTKEDLDQLNEDKNITTEMVWIEDPTEVLERTARQIVERSMNKAMIEVAQDIICELQNKPVITKTDEATLTDILDEDLQNLEKDNQSNILELAKMREVMGQNELMLGELESELSKVFSEKKDLEVMIELVRKDVSEKNQLHEEQVKKLQEQIQFEQEAREADKLNLMEYEVLKEKMDKMYENKIVMTESIWIIGPEEILERMAKQTVEEAKSEAIVEVANEDLEDTIQDGIREMEKWRGLVKDRERKLNELEIEVSKSTSERNELQAVTEHLREGLSTMEQLYENQIEELKEKLTMEQDMMKVLQDENRHLKDMVTVEKIQTCEKDVLTDMSWVEVIQVEEKYEEFRGNIQEIQEKLAKVDVAKVEVQIMTDLVWDDMCNHEQLYKEQIEEMQEQLMVERETREELQEKLAKVDVEKDEVEIMTDFVWEDMYNQEQLYKEQIEEMQEQLILEQVMREANKMKLLEYEALRESTAAIPGEDRSVMTENVCIKQPAEVLEDIVREMTNDATNKALAEVADEELQYIMENEKLKLFRFIENEQRLHELENKLSKSNNELQLMTERMKKDASKREQLERFYKEKINILQEQLIMEQDLRESEKIKFMEFEALRQTERVVLTEDKNVMTDEGRIEEAPDVLEKAILELVEKSKDEALKEVSMEAVTELTEKLSVPRTDEQTSTDITCTDIENLENDYQNSLIEMAKMRDAVELKKQMIQELQDDRSRSLVMKAEVCVMTMLSSEDIDDLENMRQQIECSVKCDKDTMTDMSWIEVIEVEEKYKEFRDNIQEIQEKLAKVDVEKDEVEIMTELVWEDMSNQEQLYKEQIEEMQEQLIVERETREELQEKLAKVDVEKDEVEIMTDLVWEDMYNQEQLYKEQIEEMQEQLIVERETREELQEKLAKVDVEKDEVEIMTDLVWEDMCNQEQLYKERIEEMQEQLIVERETRKELQEKLAKVDVEKDEVEIMTDLVWEDMCNQEQLYKEQIEEMQEQLILEQVMREANKMKLLEYEALRESSMAIPGEDKCVMTENVCIKTPEEELQLVVVELAVKAKCEAIVELAAEADFEGEMEDKEIMTEFSWKEIQYLEKTYREWVEELRQMKEDLRRQQLERKDKSCMTELLAKITTDVEIMTDLEWSEILHLENSQMTQMSELQALKNAKENKGTSEEKNTMTELKWEDIVYLETSYTEKIEELEVTAQEIKDVEHGGSRAGAVDKQAMTDLSWQNIEHLETSYQEELEKLEVLAASFNENEKEARDEEVMTELKWDEVECQLESYKDQIDHLNGLLAEKRYHGESLLTETMANELEGENMGHLPWSMDIDTVENVENLQDEKQELDIDNERKRDAESMTELTLKDVLTLETKLNSLTEEREDKEWVTDLSHEDIYDIENVAMKRTERLTNEKDESCLTDLLFDDIERSQKLEELLINDSTDNEHATTIISCDLERGQDKKELEQGQFYRITDDDERQNAEDTQEPTEPRTSTRLVEFPFTDGLDDSLTREDSSLRQNANLFDQYTSTEITLEDISYFENLEVKHHELLLKTKQQGTRSSVDGSSGMIDKNGRPIAMEKIGQETSTDLTLEVEKKKNQQDETASMFSRDSSSTEGERASIDVKEFENLKKKYEQLLEEKERWDAEGLAPGMTSIDVKDYENLNDKYNELLLEKKVWENVQAEQRLTSVDQKEYENIKEQLNELLLEKDQWEDVQNDYENVKEQLNELLLEKEHREITRNEQQQGSVDQEDYEKMKEQLFQLLLEKEQWEGAQSDQKDYENLKEKYNELLSGKEQWKAAQEDYENMKEQLNDLLLEKKQWKAAQAEQRLTSVDQEEYENMREQLNELLLEKDQWETVQSKMGLGPDDRTDYENLKGKYNELLSEKKQFEATQVRGSLDLYSSQRSKNELGTSTVLTLDDLEYYENVELDYRELQESHQQLTQQYDAIISDKSGIDKATGTEISLDDIQSLQDAENEYKNLLLTQQELLPRESKNEGVCTGMTLERLQYLEEVESIHKRCGSAKSNHVGTTTDLVLADLHYLEEVEAVHQQCMTTVDNDISSSKTDTSDMGVGTELTASVLEYLEEVAVAHKEIVREYEAFRRSVTKETEDVNLMTEVTGRHLDNLDQMAEKSEELEKMASQLAEEKRIKKERRRDSALVTELTLENLKNLEKSGNIYTELKDRGILSRLEELRKPKQKYSTVTNLLVSSIEYLEDIEQLYREQETIRNNMREKAIETDMTQSDMKRIENLANNAADTKKKIAEKVTAQTSQGLLESAYPDFNGRHGDTGRYGDRSRHGDPRGVATVEIGIQCELKDLVSLIREQHERDGGSADTKWFISELNKKSKEEYEPVEVVLRHGVRNSSTPDFTSRRDHGNKRYSLDSKRHSSNMSLNLDYGWQSTSSLDISGLDKTPLRGSGLGRWDSPRVPLAQDETFDLSDIDSAPSEESLHRGMQTNGRGESAVTQFDRYVMARKQSEKEMLEDIRENGDQEDAGEGPYQPKSMAELLNENERLKIRNMELELLVTQKGDLSDDELQLLKQKIQQLREAEEQMEKLHDSNTALKDRINQLQEENLQSGPSTSRSARDNWSEMDPSEGRTRLLLVQDWGLGESDLDSLFSAREGAVSPAESIETAAFRRLLDEYAKSDHATQAGPAPSVSQEIQTTEDLVKLIDLSYDGTIPDHIAKELEKLKAENKELYQELMELRKLKLENSTSGNRGSRDNRLEEPIRASVQSTAQSQNDWLTKLDSLGDGRSSKRRDNQDKPKVPVKDFDELFTEPAPKPQGARKQYSTRSKVKEPEVRSSRFPRDTKASVQRGLRNLDAMDGPQDVRQRADTDDILDFEFAEDAPPDFAPPPVPSEPPPDLPDNEQDDMDLDTDSLLGSSPLRDSSALRAASRQKNYPAGIAAVNEPAVHADEESNVKGEPGLGRTEVPPALRTHQTSPLHSQRMSKPPATPKPAPPPTLPKPKMAGRRVPGTPKPGLLSTPLTRSRESLNDEEGLGLTPRGYVRATASAINQGELDALGEKINFLEKQLKNKENVIRSMKTEASELEKQALLERREREIKILEDDVTFLKQENHKKERELLTKIGELNRKGYESDQWKAEANNAEKQRKRIETSYLNLQAQTRSLQGSDSKLSGLQSKYSTLEKENKQLTDKVKNLEKTEKEFKQLEYNISVLQNHLQDMESVEKERDDLLKKLKIVEDQRDDLLKKGRMVESERNDFLRNNKIMEMQRDELEQRYAMAHKNQMELKAVAEEMEDKIQDANNKTLDAQHERNFVQAQYNKLEGEKNELEKRLTAVTQERNSLETRLAELEDRSREYVKLEDGFHTLRLKAAELTRQRDDFEMQIPTLKAKVALLKKACKEKDEFIDKLNDEIRELRHAIATSTLDDLSKIRSYGYSPENFVKYSGRQRDENKKDITNGTGDTEDSKPRSNGIRSPNRPKSRNPPPKMFVAIFDYDPHKASVSGCPESELTLKEGDELMVYGDMDSNGCYEAELNGVRGLVPGLYVEEVEDGPVHSMANGTNGHEKEKTAKGRLTNGHTEPDASSGHSSMSPRSSCPDSELQRQCYVALYDYNPYQSCTTGRPELELPLTKGDIMTVIGDMDVNGYYKAEMDGQTGLVPSNFVEDVTSSSFLQPTSTTAPEQILGMLDNIKVPSPQRSGTSLPLPMPVLPNTGPSFSTHPTSASLVPSAQMGQPIPMATVVSPRRDQAIQPIFTPYMSPAEVHKLAAPINSTSNKPRIKSSQQSPRQQTTTSPRSRGITSQLSPSKHPIPSQPMTSPPQITSQVQRSSVQPVNKPKPRQSKTLVNSPQSVGHRGPPNPPSSLRVLRPVNHDAILLGWNLPEMDEFGRSNGVVVRGYKIYENGDYKMDVRSQFMSKALVDDLDLRYPIQFTVRTIASDGSHSSDVSTTFTDTINNSRMSVSKAIEDTVGNNKQVRIFVALYDYDPMKSSPNSNPQYELKFDEGDILRVEDTSRKDGFYFGSLNDKKGLIPSNFVEEVAVASALGPPSPTRKQGDPRAITNGNMNGTSSPRPTPRHRKKMIALYDYNPSEQSPLDNIHNELSFRKGQEITITGTMNKDGYYNAEINGRKGLVPASFLESPHDATLGVSPGTNKKYRS